MLLASGILANTSATSSSTAMKSLFALILFAFASLAPMPTRSYAQQGAATLTRSLDQLTEEAAVIVHGYVVSTKVEPHPKLKNLMTDVVSLRVVETYKGQPQKNLVFRQYVWDFRARVGGVEYHKGQELLLLLRPVSEYGLTSPVGLEQGRFQISRDRKGQMVAVNGRGNFGLFNSVEQRALKRGMQLSPRTLAMARKTTAGPMPLADLEDAIRTFAGVR